MGAFRKALEAGSGRRERDLAAMADEVSDSSPALGKLSDAELASLYAALAREASGDPRRTALSVLGLAKEAVRRASGLEARKVQIMAACALCQGSAAILATGEGKTIVALMTAITLACGGSVHVVTSNDYLAERDAASAMKAAGLLGLDVGDIHPQMAVSERQAAYRAAITYGTASEFGFDYLRDHLVLHPDQRVQRGRGCAIVDEADSILLDQAKTPLVIASAGNSSDSLPKAFAHAVGALSERDVEIDEGRGSCSCTEEGLSKVQEELGIDGIFRDPTGTLQNCLKQALMARFMLKRDRDYVVLDGRVEIVDGLTGRTLPGRRYSEGLHQALEAKEGVEVLPDGEVQASITLQSYFKGYQHLCGLTGTGLSDDAELRKEYGLAAEAIPPFRPSKRIDRRDRCFTSERLKLAYVSQKVCQAHEAGRPVLVGTADVKESEALSKLLEEKGVRHHILNAKDDAREAEIVSRAGLPGAVTISTDMAGRGTDIGLGGSAEVIASALEKKAGIPRKEALEQAKRLHDGWKKEVEGMGGLLVIGCCHHPSRRIDDQLRGRCARQGEPGETIIATSLDDRLVRERAPRKLEEVRGSLRRGQARVEPGKAEDLFRSAQLAAEREDEEARSRLLSFDEHIRGQREALYAARDRIVDGSLPDLPEVVARTCQEAAGEAFSADSVHAPKYLQEWAARRLGISADLGKAMTPEIAAEALDDAASSAILAARGAHADAGWAEVVGGIFLKSIDRKWAAWLGEVSTLERGIGLRSWGQRDPETEFGEEVSRGFGRLPFEISCDAISTICMLAPSKDRPGEGMPA